MYQLMYGGVVAGLIKSGGGWLIKKGNTNIELILPGNQSSKQQSYIVNKCIRSNPFIFVNYFLDARRKPRVSVCNDHSIPRPTGD